MKTVIIKVGQVWIWNNDLKITSIITRIIGGMAYSKDHINDTLEHDFSKVNENDLAEIHDSWTLQDIECHMIETKPLSRECLCGIFRQDCDYHRTP